MAYLCRCNVFCVFAMLSMLAFAGSSPSVPTSCRMQPGSNVLLRGLLALNTYVAKLPLLGAFSRDVTIWDLITLVAAGGILQVYRRSWAQRKRRQNPISDSKQTEGTDPGLLKKYSEYKAYTTSIGTYHQVRTFYRPHAQADKLPNKPKPLPLLVFVHGLGGSLAQFTPLLTSLVNVGPCLGFDLPGCGLSRYATSNWEAYSHSALAELVSVVVTETCQATRTQEVVFIGHSMGCSLVASLISTTSPIASSINFEINVIGFVAICPKASMPSAEQVQTFRKLLNIPTPIFDLWRRWDRIGGVESTSVHRFVGSDAHAETKKLQMQFNEQSKTGVWRRMASGALPSIDGHGKVTGGLPGPEVWKGLTVPIFLIAGESDHVTKPEEINVISTAMGKEVAQCAEKTDVMDAQALSTELPKGIPSGRDLIEDTFSRPHLWADSSETEATTTIPLNRSGNDVVISADHVNEKVAPAFKTSVLPNPAGHALLYDHNTYRTLSGLIQSFLAAHIDHRLSLGWQLQHLKEANKWDVKNLAKWQGVQPVSESIACIFRAMKTLREVDDIHSPVVFVRKWRDKIKAVIDISHDTPVYNPQDLDDGGIEYHKFATVSKIPPTTEEVRHFVKLVDQLRSESSEQYLRLIGVHCHYGFNRTGFFLCSYLIERESFSVQQAIEEFRAKRPPGIRHEHFLDTLYVRYCVGLKRAPTL